MGAELIGYYLAVDEKKAPRILTKALEKWNKVMKDFPKGSKTSANPEGVQAIIKAALKLGYEPRVLEDIEDDVDKANQILSDYDIIAHEDDHHIAQGFRDMASMHINLKGGVKLLVLFAGEMTWGDEPSGAGYAYLKALDNTGITNKLWYNAKASKG